MKVVAWTGVVLGSVITVASIVLGILAPTVEGTLLCLVPECAGIVLVGISLEGLGG